MAQVAIQLSDDEDLQRLRARADALAISTEAMATEAVMDLLNGERDLPGFGSRADYEAFVQEGIDSAEQEALVEADVVFAEMRARLDDLLARRPE